MKAGNGTSGNSSDGSVSLLAEAQLVSSSQSYRPGSAEWLGGEYAAFDGVSLLKGGWTVVGGGARPRGGGERHSDSKAASERRERRQWARRTSWRTSGASEPKSEV